MKLFFRIKILLLLFLLSFVGYSQVRGTNVILVSDVSFTQAVNTLVDNGYSISSQSEKTGFIVTGLREIKKDKWWFILKVRVADSVAIIRGDLKNKKLIASGGVWDYLEIKNQGRERGFKRAAFNYMLDYAKILKGKIEFDKR